MTTTTTHPTSLVFPEIAASDLEAARRFLIADRDPSESIPAFVRPRTSNLVRDRKNPVVHLGITRARCRSTVKVG